MLKEEIGITALRDVAICVLSCVAKGEIFIVQNLFPKMVWDNLSAIKRAELGHSFWDYIQSDEGKSLASPLDKTDVHQQRYVKL